MKGWRDTAYSVPVWILASQPVGFVRGWYATHWVEAVVGSAFYCALGFWAGYCIALAFARERPAVKAAGGIAGIVAFFLFTISQQ